MAVPRQAIPPEGDESEDNGSTVILGDESEGDVERVDITVDDISTDGESLAVVDEVEMEGDRMDTGEIGIADDNLLGKFQIDADFILVF